jgi:ferredoxin
VADALKRVPGSAIGEFFVDRTCIGCETSAQLAPEIFEEAVECYRVNRLPVTRGENHRATGALLACPVGAIGTLHPTHAKAVIRDLPLQIDGRVYYSVRRPAGACCSFSRAVRRHSRDERGNFHNSKPYLSSRATAASLHPFSWTCRAYSSAKSFAFTRTIWADSSLSLRGLSRVLTGLLR